MKTIAKNLVFLVVFVSVLAGFSSQALAASPILSVTMEGGFGNVRITVTNADPYAQITLYRRQTTTLWTTISNFGQTDASGYFSSVQSLGSDGSNNSVDQYVMVNGLISNTVQTYPNGYNGGCTYNCGSPYGLSLSQNSVNLNIGQSQTVTAYNNSNYYNYNNYGNIYIGSNSNSSVVSASVSGNQINLYGLSAGSASVNVCANNSQCASIYVTVGGGNCLYYNCTGGLNLSQTSLVLTVGQNSSIYANNNYGTSLYVASNSNSSVASATANGSTVNFYALSSGSTSVSICANNYGQCAYVYVTVTGSNYGSLSLSPSTVNLNLYQSQSVSIYNSSGYSGSYYVSANTNSGAVTPTVSGSTLNLYGSNTGSSTVTVCQNNINSCASVYVTVGGGGYCTYNCNNNISFSQNNLNVSVGQTATVSIYGNSGYYGNNFYVSSNSNPNAATVSVSGSAVNIYGSNYGSTTAVICQTNASYCGSLYITVGSNSGYNSGSLYLSTTSLPVAIVGQLYNYQLQVTGGTAPYYFSITSGNLPSGLSLSTNGLISGYAGYTSSITLGIRITDAYGRMGNGSINLSTAFSGTNYGYNNSYYNGNVLGASIYSNGTLIKEGSTIYIVYKNTKSGFASLSVFQGLGYKLGNVMRVTDSGLTDSGYVVNTTRTAHPWGSWIKSGNTVYFVHDSGLIPVSSWDVFLNNGGDGKNIVPANIYDFQKNILTTMDYNDSRLR